MKRGKVLVLAFLAVLMISGSASALRPQPVLAHPLGNFTVNTLSVIDVAAEQITVEFVVDMAEIPTFQERANIDLNGDEQLSNEERSAYVDNIAEQILDGLVLRVNNSSLSLRLTSREMEFIPGQGDLATTRIAMSFLGDIPEQFNGEVQDIYFRNDNYLRKRGMKQVVIRAVGGASLINSTAPDFDVTDGLRFYPQELLNNPPAINEVRASFAPASASINSEAPTADAIVKETSQSSDILTSLISRKELGPSVVVLAILIAVGLGALHASSPGHGKTIMAAYLVGTRGTAKHALFLGTIVTISHTIGVLGLGLVVLFASHIIAPDILYPWLSLTSGVVIIIVGLWLLVSRFRNIREGQPTHHHESESHSHAHSIHKTSFFERVSQLGTKVFHGHSHDHSHTPVSPQEGNKLKLTWQSLTALGIVGGLVPSASALIILLAAISLQRVSLGIMLILAFSIGMAMVLTGVGLALVYAGRFISKIQFSSGRFALVSRLMPYTTALVILVSGLVVATRGMLQISL